MKTLYSRNKYPSKGKKRERDYLGDSISATKSCMICSATLYRKQSPKTGISETYDRFYNRKTCGNEYTTEGKTKPSKCLTKWRAIPENNGRYIGVMHRRCIVCGKMGLSYTRADHRPKMCGDCLLTNRPPVWNKEHELFTPCSRCGKPASNRLPSGNLKKNHKVRKKYCSQECFFNRKN